jgi:hypothetical protein
MNKATYLLNSLFLLICHLAFSQQLQWQNTLGTNSNDLITDIQIDNAGATYVCAHSYGEVNFNSIGENVTIGNDSSSGISYLIKYNINKQVEWIYSVDVTNGDDYINSVCYDATGNVYITGFIGGFFNAATNPDSTNIIGSTYGSAFLIKLSSMGEYIWGKSFGSVNMPGSGVLAPWPKYVNGLKVITKDNEIFITGIYKGPTQFDSDSLLGNLNPISNNSLYHDIFICKYNTEGDFQWVFRLASQGADAPSDLSFDNAGNLLISGLQGGALNFDPNGIYGPPIKGTSDCFMAKYTSQGTFIWAFVFGGSLGSDRVNSITSDENNNVYIVGEYRDTVDFAPTGVVYGISTGLKDAFLAKYSPSKALLWVKSFGNANDNESFNSIGYAIGNLYTTGSFANELQLNNANLATLYSNGLNDAMVAVFDTNGFAQQSFAIGSKLADEGLIIQPNNNHVFVGGYYRDSVDFALDTNVSLTTCVGGYDLFIAEYNMEEVVNKIKSTKTEISGLNLFPNPNNGSFSVNFSEQKISGLLEVYDLNGQLLQSEYVAPWSYTKQVNLQHQLSNGMYALRLSFGKQAGLVKFVVE